MLTGHIAVGLVGKRLAPHMSLGTVVMASLAVDLLWCVLLIVGIEHVQIRPGHTTQDSLLASQISFSHSLVMDGLWASLFAVMYFAIRNYRRGAWVLFAAVLSHWLLDLVSHRADMPLAPGVPAYFGLGLWDSVSRDTRSGRRTVDGRHPDICAQHPPEEAGANNSVLGRRPLTHNRLVE